MAESKEKSYNQVSGTFYHSETPAEVIKILEHSRRTGARIRLHYGDTKTGRDWLEEWGMTGNVSRSMGPIKIPILIETSRSMGGGGILDHCIVRIRAAAGGQDLYRHPLYNFPDFTLTLDPSGATTDLTKRVASDFNKYPFAVLADGTCHARFETAEKRSRWFHKMGFPEPLS